MKQNEFAARMRLEELGYASRFAWGLESSRFRNISEEDLQIEKLDEALTKIVGLSRDQVRTVADAFARADVPGRRNAHLIPPWVWWWLLRQAAKQAAAAVAKGAVLNALDQDETDTQKPLPQASPVGTPFSSGWFQHCQKELLGELRPGESIRITVSWNGGGWGSVVDDPGVVEILKDGTNVGVVRGDGAITITGPGKIEAHLTGNEKWCWIESESV